MSRYLPLIAVVLFLASLGCQPSATETAKIDSQAKRAATKASPNKPTSPPEQNEPNLGQARATAPPRTQTKLVTLTKPTATPDKGSLTVDWPQFRGPMMLGSDPFATVPIRWNAEDGVLWKVEVIDGVKSRGASSPIVVGDRVFLTAFTGCGTSKQDRENVSDLQHHVICLDKFTGEKIWQRTIQGSLANRRLSEHALVHGYASSTPIVDGERLFTFFGISGVFAFDLDGNFLWQTDVGSRHYDFGSSAALGVFEDLLFVNASIESSTLYALDKSTGHVRWLLNDVAESWSAPIVAATNAGDHELILNQKGKVRGLDPRTGAVLWHCEGVQDYVVATPIVVDGTCYLTGGKEHQCMAIKLGGRGDVTESHKIWQIRGGSNVSSPIYHDGVLYTVAANGILRAIDTKNGKELFRQRMGVPQQILASPVILGDHMFVPSQYKGVVVLNLLDQCKVVSRNAFSGSDVPLQASIAVSDNHLFMRTDDHVYCVGQPGTISHQATVARNGTIIPNPKFDIDEKTGRQKTFVRCLVTTEKEILDFMLLPYKSVITPEQTSKSTEYILANHQPFIDFRQQYLDLKWDYMTGKKPEKVFTKELADLEKQTMQHNYKVRKFIKDMFSEEQMDQHLRENGIIRKKTK